MKKISILFIFYRFVQCSKITSHELSIINQGDVHSALPIYQTTDANQHKTLLNLSSEADPT
jgi:peptide deformylase